MAKKLYVAKKIAPELYKNDMADPDENDEENDEMT